LKDAMNLFKKVFKMKISFALISTFDYKLIDGWEISFENVWPKCDPLWKSMIDRHVTITGANRWGEQRRR
jgi:hypothetical protein